MEKEINIFSAVRTTSVNADFLALVKMLDADLNDRYGALQKQYDVYNTTDLISHVIVLYEEQIPIGCGAMKPFDDSCVEIKRMFVKPESRGKGAASRILLELEKWARELEFTSTVLETGRNQTEAIFLYKKRAYKQTENYGQYKNNPNSLCFRKDLSSKSNS